MARFIGKMRMESHVATLSALCPTHPFMSLCPPPLPNVPLAVLGEATIHSKKNSFISNYKSRYNFQMVTPTDKRDNGGTEGKYSFSSITRESLRIIRSRTADPTFKSWAFLMRRTFYIYLPPAAMFPTRGEHCKIQLMNKYMSFSEEHPLGSPRATFTHEHESET